MRMEIITHDSIVSLGDLAKDIFAEEILSLNSNGLYFNIIQEVREDTKDRINQLSTNKIFNSDLKKSCIEAFSTMSVGEKFLCINAWLLNMESEEAYFYRYVQRLCNQGCELDEAMSIANDLIQKEFKKGA